MHYKILKTCILLTVIQFAASAADAQVCCVDNVVKFGTSLDSTGKIIFDKYGLRSYIDDKRKLTFRDGPFGNRRFSSLTLLFNQSDQLYSGIFIFRPDSYLDMIYEYRYLKWLIELKNGKPGISVDEYPGGRENVKNEANETIPSNGGNAHFTWLLPAGSDEKTATTIILLKANFKNSSPVIFLEYRNIKFGKEMTEGQPADRITNY